jgi:Phage integrase family
LASHCCHAFAQCLVLQEIVVRGLFGECELKSGRWLFTSDFLVIWQSRLAPNAGVVRVDLPFWQRIGDQSTCDCRIWLSLSDELGPVVMSQVGSITERAFPGSWEGADELELDHIDCGRLTIYGAKSGGGGKRDRTRTIDLKVMGGTALFGEIPRYLGSPYVFWHDDGEPFTNFFSHFHRKVKAIARWAKANGVDFRPFTFHSLRHWHAIEFLRSRTGTLHELQFRLGHSTIKTTEEYINSGLLSAEEVQWALFGGRSHGLDFSGPSGHKSGHSGGNGGPTAGRNALI